MVRVTICADCAVGEIACPNFEFGCKSMEQWTKCLTGPRAGHCISRIHECDPYDQCLDNHASIGCREFFFNTQYCIELTDQMTNNHQYVYRAVF